MKKTDIKKEIGKKLQQRRKMANLKQSELAAALHIDASALSRIETGDRDLTAAELALAANKLGILASSLLPIIKDY